MGCACSAHRPIWNYHLFGAVLPSCWTFSCWFVCLRNWVSSLCCFSSICLLLIPPLFGGLTHDSHMTFCSFTWLSKPLFPVRATVPSCSQMPHCSHVRSERRRWSYGSSPGLAAKAVPSPHSWWWPPRSAQQNTVSTALCTQGRCQSPWPVAIADSDTAAAGMHHDPFQCWRCWTPRICDCVSFTHSFGNRMAFEISSAFFVGSRTQEVEEILIFGGCGTGPKSPGCWGLIFSGPVLGLHVSVSSLPTLGVSYLSRVCRRNHGREAFHFLICIYSVPILSTFNLMINKK